MKITELNLKRKANYFKIDLIFFEKYFFNKFKVDIFSYKSFIKQPISQKSSCEQAINKAQINKETTANDLNTYGMRCYKEKRFDDAATLFQKAIRLDENHVLANYNYACMRQTIYGDPKTASDMANLFDGITLWGENPGVYLLGDSSSWFSFPDWCSA